MSLVLIIDDDRQLCLSFSKILSQDGYRTANAYSGREGIEQVKALHPDLVILDVRLPDISGIEVFDTIHAIFPKLPVIIITAFSTTETAIGAIQKGAFDYIYKPFDVPEMLKVVEKAADAGRSMSTPVAVNPELENLSDQEALVGTSNLMLEVYKAIGRVTSTDATVLIRGESGTGKELASRAVYNHSLRADSPYIIINCVAIPESLLESELFGYEKGAFTGAQHRKIGKIEQAQGGTVFLDEIGDMSLATQSKFLRLLQEKTIERIGGKGPINVDVRIIAATNRDLEKAVAEGSFREDLYYRLRVVTITMPPLRQRKDDIPLLCHYLLAKLSREMAIENPGITLETLDKIKGYDWPGNIREMGNTLKKALIFNRGSALLPEDIALYESSKAQQQENSGYAINDVRKWVRSSLLSNPKEKLYDSCLDNVASILVEEALELCNGNRSKAARLLGITRPTLHAKMEKYTIE